MKYLTDFDPVKRFEINIFSGIFELHNYSTMFGKKPASLFLLQKKTLPCSSYHIKFHLIK